MGKQKKLTNLRKLLNERNISATALAKSTRLSERTVQRIAAGTSKPDVRAAEKIAKKLKMEVSDIF